MSTNLRQIAYQAQRDVGNLWPGMTSAADVEADILAAINQLIDEWAMQRLFIYQGSTGSWTILTAFPDMTTAYNFAPGNLQLLRKAMGQTIAAMMMIYRKAKVAEPMLEQINAEANAALVALRGVGPP